MIINLSVHCQIYVLINKFQVQLTAVNYQQSFWLVAFPQRRMNISLGDDIGVLLIVEQDITNQSLSLMLSSRITKQHIVSCSRHDQAWKDKVKCTFIRCWHGALFKLSGSSDREGMANFVLGLNRVLIGKPSHLTLDSSTTAGSKVKIDVSNV